MRGEESHKNVKVTQNKTPIEKYFMLDLCMDIYAVTTLSLCLFVFITIMSVIIIKSDDDEDQHPHTCNFNS